MKNNNQHGGQGPPNRLRLPRVGGLLFARRYNERRERGYRYLLCVQGLSHHDAEDVLTQYLIKYFREENELGMFKIGVYFCRLKNVMLDCLRHQRAKKRGGGVPHCSFDGLPDWACGVDMHAAYLPPEFDCIAAERLRYQSVRGRCNTGRQELVVVAILRGLDLECDSEDIREGSHLADLLSDEEAVIFMERQCFTKSQLRKAVTRVRHQVDERCARIHGKRPDGTWHN